MELVSLKELKDMLKEHDIKGYIKHGCPDDEYSTCAQDIYNMLKIPNDLSDIDRPTMKHLIGVYWHGYWEDTHDSSWSLEEAKKETKELSRNVWAIMLMSEVENVLRETD